MPLALSKYSPVVTLFPILFLPVSLPPFKIFRDQGQTRGHKGEVFEIRNHAISAKIHFIGAMKCEKFFHDLLVMVIGLSVESSSVCNHTSDNRVVRFFTA